MKYTLQAGNIQGATVEFKGDTMKAVFNEFKNTYYTSGWMIVIYCNETGKTLKTIKSTYR